MAQTTEYPAHVSPERVIDFDVYDPPNLQEEGFHESWAKLLEPGVPEIVWSTRNGGHWMPTRGRLVARMFTDDEHFSSRLLQLPRDVGEAFFSIPASLDRPEHLPFRSLLSSNLGPKSVNKLEDDIRAFAISLIEEIKLAGSCDFTKAYAEILPIHMFMRLVDLPVEDAPELRRLQEHRVIVPGSPMTPAEAMRKVQDYLRGPISVRLGGTGDDLFSRIVNGKVNGRALTLDEAINISLTVLGGGLDTVMNLLSFVMHFLATSPSHRQALRENPALIPDAVEELLRRFPIVTMAREVRKEVVYEGVRMLKGDPVILPTELHGLDPRENGCPMTVDFNRPVRRHSAFGGGPHRCPGTHLARLETRITIEEWLARIPDFEVAGPVSFGPGQNGGMVTLPLRW